MKQQAGTNIKEPKIWHISPKIFPSTKQTTSSLNQIEFKTY